MPSAGAYKREVDLSLYTEIGSNLVFGVAHTFSKGPINERTLITNLPSLEATFGRPIDDDVHCQGFFALREYFRNGNQAHVVRVEAAANPAASSKAALRGATDDLLITAADGATSIPATRTLTSAGSDFVAAGVLAGDVVQIHDVSSADDNGFYVIETVATTILTVDRDLPVGSLSTVEFTVWTSYKSGGADGETSVPSSRQLTSATAEFQSAGVLPGDVVYINDTSDEGDNGFYSVASVTSETVLVLNRNLPEGSLTALTFKVYGANHPTLADGVTSVAGEFSSAAAQLDLHGVQAGDLLVIEDSSTTGANGTYVISGLKSGSEDTTVEVENAAWPEALTALSYYILPGAAILEAESEGTWADDYVLKPVANPVIAGQFDLEVYDAGGFLKETIAGLTQATMVADMLASSVTFPTATIPASRIGPSVEQSAVSRGGDDGTTGLVDADFIGTGLAGLQLFKNTEEVEIDVLEVPGYTSQNITDAVGLMAESGRGDCMAIVDAPDAPTCSSPAEAVDWTNGTGGFGRTSALNSSFVATYYSWQKIYDPYHDKDRYTAPSGHAVSVWAQSENATYPWFAPAGLKRGKVKGASDVRYSPDQGERDYMQDGNNLNPIVKFVKDGIHVYGQKTMLRASSALNRVNVRRMLLYLERNMLQAAKYVTFEPNDSATDRELVRLITPLLEYVQKNRGISEFLVVIDDTTSPAAVRAANKLIGRIYIKPTTTAEIIELQFTLTAQTANFAELLAA